MGNWKSKLRVSDLSPDTKLELQCKKCGQIRYLTVAYLIKRNAEQLYIDQVEKRALCRVHGCKGLMRLSLSYKHQETSFVGGMA